MKAYLSAAAALCIGTAALAGPNAGGTLIVVLSEGTVYSDENSGYCGSATATDCKSAVTRSDSDDVVVLNVIAAFLSTSRLSGVTFGVSYADGITIPEYGSCGDLELPTGSWPASGEGTAVTWATVQVSQLVEVYWFAAYNDDGTPNLMSLAPHPTQGANFADDDVPSNIDPIAALGEFGFNTEGHAPCPSVQPGACCFDDGRCSILLAGDCLDQGAVYQGDGTLCEPNPCPPGACCFADGGCVLLVEYLCEEQGGVFLGPDTECDSTTCPQPGACCHPDGDCEVVLRESCPGEYLGDGTLCDPNPCAQSGACCHADGHCSFVTLQQCQDSGGAYQGDGVSCENPNPCPQNPGACCFDDGHCELLAEYLCDEEGGSFFGEGVPCDPNPCPPARGACCVETGCQVLTENECGQNDGHYLGDNVPCSPNACCGSPRGTRRGIAASNSDSGSPQASTGRSRGTVTSTEGRGGCGTLLFNTDGTYENGYTWRYGGVVPPDYGAFAECYFGKSTVCSAVYDFSSTGTQECQDMDIFVYNDAGGVPGPVIYAHRVTPGPVAFWPSISRHTFSINAPCTANAWWVAYWGNWPGNVQGWFVAADLDGSGGCPYTNIAPGVGYPTGWNNVSVVWGPTRAVGIGAEVNPCGGSPTIETTWGEIKRLFQGK